MKSVIIFAVVVAVIYKLVVGHTDHPVKWNRPDWN